MSGRVLVGIIAASALAGCGGAGTKPVTTKTAASTSGSSLPAWQPGTPAPKVTAALIGQAGYGLDQANTSLGTVDEVFGAVPAAVHVNPSAKTLNDQYARFGRCMAEDMKIHDLGHELALLVAYNRNDHTVQAAVEQASKVCAGLVITPDANFKQSLKANP
jgi:hypothetical protein